MRRLISATGLLLVVLLGFSAPALAHPPGDSGVAESEVDGLSPGEFIWRPEIEPHGPLTAIISLPAQRASVYRGGVRIGGSTVSTGKKGYETPAGVFTVVQKERMHHSNKYDNAPMPYMQRLTWSGLAMHSGRVRSHPSSHGCVRMPPGFSKALFQEPSMGMRVVITRRRNTNYVEPPPPPLPEVTPVASAPTESPRHGPEHTTIETSPTEWDAPVEEPATIERAPVQSPAPG
ncbi:MAG: L,D-transpeptidase family protein [Alphaproteobacteria bacterium]|jgi:hypothetical protein